MPFYGSLGKAAKSCGWAAMSFDLFKGGRDLEQLCLRKGPPEKFQSNRELNLLWSF